MSCSACGKPSEPSHNFCKYCGNKITNPAQLAPPPTPVSSRPKRWPYYLVRFTILAVIIGFGVLSSLDDEAVNQNNTAYDSFEAGNDANAISQFEQAAQSAYSDDTKITALKNAAYVYSSNGELIPAKTKFKEALALTSLGSFDYYLIQGEIAALESKPNVAIINYNKAYSIDSVDFQINNALALFYLDINDAWPDYVDYSKALRYAKAAHQANPSELTRQNLAVAHFFNENFSQTISLLSQTNLNDHPEAMVWLGLAYYSNGDYDKARFQLQRSIDAGLILPDFAYEFLNEESI